MKKNAIGFYFNVLAAILGIAGLVCTVLSSSGDNALSGLSMIIAAGVVAIALVIVAIYSPMKNGNHDPIAAVSVIAAIALFMYVFNQCVSQRVNAIFSGDTTPRPAAVSPGHGSNCTSSVVCRSPALPARNS